MVAEDEEPSHDDAGDKSQFIIELGSGAGQLTITGLAVALAKSEAVEAGFVTARRRLAAATIGRIIHFGVDRL